MGKRDGNASRLIDLEVRTKKQDPYHDMRLNESLPQTLINLPISISVTATVDEYGPQGNSFELV